METGESDPIVPALREAERAAEKTLEEACATKPASEADTGELIHIDELLESASDAVKRAISLRRRRRADAAVREAARAAMADLEAEASAEETHRIFRDARGVRWDAFAVHPGERLALQHQLSGTYAQGWLCFDSASQKRRLSPIPQHWFRLTNGELAQLAERAEVVPPEGVPSHRRSGQDDRPASG